MGNWSGPGCEVYIKPYLKKGFFGLPGSGKGSCRGSPSVTLKPLMIRPSNLHRLIQLSFLTNTGNVLGARLVTGIAT